MDRRSFFATAGVAGTGQVLSYFRVAEAEEQRLILNLERTDRDPTKPRPIEVGTGRLFVPPGSAEGATPRDPDKLEPMPAQPKLVDFFRLRFATRHVFQSANRALKLSMSEETVLGCLLHDIVLDLVRPDHGWWGAQLLEPYVPERVSWAIRYHQALRFYPDLSVGYEYPELYVKLFGADYKPDPYIEEAYKYARNHRWYMEARKITMNDDYSFDPSLKLSIDPFVDIIGRHFKQPKEGLGFDGSPVAHMWRTLIHPDRPL